MLAKLIYNFIIIPLVYFIITLLSFFNRKLHRSIHARDNTLRSIGQKRLKINPYSITVLFHCSSMGEYKQILPIAHKLDSSTTADYNLVLSLFSPSVYDNLDKNDPMFDMITYTPFDFYFQTKKFINTINPDLVLISKHDIWPNFVWELKKREIPVYLINALFADDTKMDKWYAVFFFRSIFAALTGIITVNEKNRQRFLNIFPKPDRIFISGDSRYDTVIYEAGKSKGIKELDNLNKCNKIFVAGSSWLPGEKIIIETWPEIKRKFADSFLVIVPHDVGIGHIYKIESLCQEQKLKTLVFSEMKMSEDILSYDVLIIDRIGMLANIYRYGSIAYIGGGFSRFGLHSVIEPAVFGLPVFFGPNLDKSPEAREMNNNNCGMIFSDKNELFKLIDDMWSDRDLYANLSSISLEFIKNNSGATEKILQIVLDGKTKNSKLDKTQTLTEEEFKQMLENE